jgi:hypothetical protein
VIFRTETGGVLLKRFPGQGPKGQAVERQHQEWARQKIAQYGEVTLFGD